MEQTILLEKDIGKLDSLINKTKSKRQKRNYIIILQSLLPLLSELKNEKLTYEFPDDMHEEYMVQLEIDNKKLLYQQISNPNYKADINYICKKGLSHLKSYQDSLFFNETIKWQNAKELIIDFFNQFDQRLLPIIKQTTDEEHLYFFNDHSKNGEGYSLYNPYSDNPYINLYIDQKLKLNNIQCLVHEIGHIIGHKNYHAYPSLLNESVYNSFLEVPALAFELLFLDFLIENKIYEKDAEKAIHNNLCTLNYYLSLLKIINRVISDIDILRPYEIQELQTILRNSGIVQSDVVTELCFNDICSKYQYSYGQLIALYYLSKYKNDKEKYKHYILSFTNNIGFHDDYYMLNNFGINFDEFKHCKYLKKEVERNQKQLSKNLN